MKGIRRIICALLALVFLLGLVPMDASVAAAEAGQLGEAIIEGNRDFKWPVPDYHNISACFFDDRDHYAIDIGTMTTNADIVASYDGEVAEITRNGANDYGYGNAVMLKHTYTTSSGTITLYSRYAHMSEISESLSVGSAVVGGETVLGKTGGSGYGSANYYAVHLDFQILTSNDWLNRQTCSIDPFANNLLELPADLYLGRTSDCCQSYIDAIKALYAGDAHTHSYESAVTPPTCTEDGYTTYTCPCGDSYTDDEVTAPGHSYGADGVCTVCGDVEALGGTCGDNLTWELDANGVLTISGTGDMTDYNYNSAYRAPWYNDRAGITSVVIESGVTGIGREAFYKCYALTEITIANSVTNIGGKAFSNCDALTEITIPDSVTSIGAAAFSVCGALTEITIPDSVTIIGASAFSNCSSLTEVVIGKGVTSIGSYAFEHCSSLTEITIPNSVTSIGDSAFRDCHALTDITITNSATSIGDSAFFNCKALTDVYYGGTAEEWSRLSNRPYAKHIHYSSINADNHWGEETSEQDPNCTEKGGKYKTCDCGYKKYVGEVKPALGHSYGKDYICTVCGAAEPRGRVTFIDGMSLSWGELQKAENGEKYGYDAAAITDDTIGASAFYNCQKIVGIFIHKGVTVIGDNAFNLCSNLNHVLFAGTEEEWSAINIGGANDRLKNVENHFEAEPEDFYSHINCVCVAHYCSACGFFNLRNISGAAHNFVDGECTECDAISEFEYTINSEGVNISGYNGTGPNIIIPAYIEGLPVRAIYLRSSIHKDKITGVTIPYGVTTIGSFFGFKNLTSINIPNSVTKIDDSAFQGCSSLTSIEIPNSVTSIADSAFEGCDGLKTVLIPSSVKEMGDRIFAGCDSLESVTFADGATIVGPRMFEDCSNLESVYLPDSLKQIKSGAFRNCVNLTSIELPDGLEMIWNKAFIGCSKITSVYFGKNLKSIGEDAFSGCFGITEFHIADLAAWCAIEFAGNASRPVNVAIEIKVFVNGEHITELVIPEGVTSIGDYAFCYFRDLTSVVIPNTVTSIGKNAFYECKNISNTIVIPESVTSIGASAFGACRNITDVVIL
ncbi:MAG: leucine-rich repeat protein, partial [Oscillospiraceae bacterium]|nr:leucine-rich repeat protein [Oscillospiraceae bacterium]